MNDAVVDQPVGFEPRLPTAEECSLGLTLQRRAQVEPDAPFVVFETGAVWSNRQAFDACLDMAARLAALGVKAGDMVVNWQPNGPDHFRVLFACSMLGATEAPINIAYRGGLLAHALAVTGARVMVAHPELVQRLTPIETAVLESVLVPGSEPAMQLERLRVVAERDVSPMRPAPRVETNQPWDVVAIIFTSGTTGPSKGVRTTYAQQWTTGRAMYPWIASDDRMLVSYPLFHIAPLSALFSAVTVGGTIAVTEPVTPPKFWNTVRRLGVTAVSALGAPAAKMLCEAPAAPDDHDNPLRVVGFTHVDPDVREFAHRFGVDVIARYSMSETSCVTTTHLNPSKDRTVGHVRKGIEVRLVDENDIEVPTGVVGQLIVRADLPWVLNVGYQGNPEATAQAWRNGWFHTGDLLRCDEDGDLFYVGRSKDAIRRRGENISAYEVEVELSHHPEVTDVAVIGVGRAADQEVLAIVVRRSAGLEPAELLEFLRPRLAHFMLPRYIRFVDEIPKTHNNKVQKAQFRQEGLTADCWDREAAGVIVRRVKLAT